MKEIISKLSRVAGVNGVLVVSDDGLLIAAESNLGGRATEETVSALVGKLGRTIATSLERLGRGEIKTVMVSAMGGRALLTCAGSAYVIALVASDANLGLIQLELGTAASEAVRSIPL